MKPEDIASVEKALLARAKSGDQTVLRSPELRSLYDGLKSAAPESRAELGKRINDLKIELEKVLAEQDSQNTTLNPIDITAPWDVNTPTNQRPDLLTSNLGSIHPLSQELARITDIFYRMGFVVEPSREIDDDYHMFGSLNFPDGHPARDDWDTFMTDDGLIAPAHTSTMQNRVLQKYKSNLEAGEPIAAVVPDRVFRNEDLDATHEHTFHQVEGVYVGKGVTVGNLIAVLKSYMSEFFGQELNVKIQPFYFPFTEPSFEFAVERPDVLKRDNSEAEKWLEIGGCGMIHPNVLKAADIDPTVYTGFAWGFGVERMVMLRNGIEDIRHFNSGKIEFLRQFA